MNIRKFVSFFLISSLSIGTTIASEKPRVFIMDNPSLEFHSYSKEYFEYARTPQDIKDAVLKSDKPHVLEIGSGEGYFAEELLLSASEQRKKIGFASVEFNEKSRVKLGEIFNHYKKHPFNHDCLLSQVSNVTDYIQRKPEMKKEFFSAIISFYTLHGLCPTDLINTFTAFHSFLKRNGTLWLTLQSCEVPNNRDELHQALEERYQKGDLFPGFNLRRDFAPQRLSYFLHQSLDYPLSSGSGDRRDYNDPYQFAHDFCPLLPTLHDPKWTKELLEKCGFDVDKCGNTEDEYPAHPLALGEVSRDGIQTKYLFVKAVKRDNKPNVEAIESYLAAAKAKELEIFNLYQEAIKQ